jgi:hypothetical protein
MDPDSICWIENEYFEVLIRTIETKRWFIEACASRKSRWKTLGAVFKTGGEDRPSVPYWDLVIGLHRLGSYRLRREPWRHFTISRDEPSQNSVLGGIKNR